MKYKKSCKKKHACLFLRYEDEVKPGQRGY